MGNLQGWGPSNRAGRRRKGFEAAGGIRFLMRNSVSTLALIVGFALAATLILPPPTLSQGPITPGPRRPTRPRPAPPIAEDPGATQRPTTTTTTSAPRPTVPEPTPEIETRAPIREPIGTIPTFTSETNVVTVDTTVISNKGVFLPGIPQGNFVVLEDGVPQKIESFGQNSDAPMTVAIVVEFSNAFQRYWSETWYQTLTLIHGFVSTLRQQDWAAVVAYDLKPEILTDFTQNPMEIKGALQRLNIPAYSESNLFDALEYTIDRMEPIEGRKSIVLISTGVDTFSRLTFKEARQTVQEGGVAIYSIGLMQAIREWYDSRGALGGAQRMTFLQADNQLRTFSRETGGMSFFPRFYGEFPSIFQNIHYSLRNQYTLTYVSTNPKRDGAFREIEVRLVDPTSGEELQLRDQKNKRIKYEVLHKPGYTAPREVE